MTSVLVKAPRMYPIGQLRQLWQLRRSPLNSSACCVFFIPCGFRNYVRGKSRRSRERRERPLHYIENVEGPAKRFPPVSLSYPLNFPKSIMQLFPTPLFPLTALRQECVRALEREREPAVPLFITHIPGRPILSLLFRVARKSEKLAARAFKRTLKSKEAACYCFLLPARFALTRALHVGAWMNARVCQASKRERESECVC